MARRTRVGSREEYSRKRRTREHVIADLGVNHVERHVLLAGHIVRPTHRDYGIDLTLSSFSERGEVERGEISIQVKATEKSRSLSRRAAVAVRVERRDLRAWLDDSLPVVLVLYDVSADRANWVYVQRHLKQQRKSLMRGGSRWVTIHLPDENVLNAQAVRELVEHKRKLLPHLRAVASEYE
jgi:hypothetical protein